MHESPVDVIVIGCGVAGMTAARIASEKGLSVLSIEPGLFGGLVLNINRLDGMPGGSAESGYRLSAKMKLHNTRLGIPTVAHAVTAIGPDGGTLLVRTKEGKYVARAVVVASGARLKTLGLASEEKFLNKGVSRCADCDGPLFRDETVAVVGGGDSAVQAALTLAEGCARVYVVQRDTRLTARPHLLDALPGKTNIEVVLDADVQDILGGDAVSGLRLHHRATGEVREIDCVGVFAYVGLEPVDAFVPDTVRRDADGYLQVDDACRTDMPGVFAIGAVRSGFGGLLTDAMADAGRVVDAVMERVAGHS